MTDGPPHPDPDLERFAERLRRLRAVRGWSLTDLAAATTFSRAFLSRLENAQRQPSLSVLLALSRAYGVHVSGLIDAEPDRQAESEPGQQLYHRRAELVWDTGSTGTLRHPSNPDGRPFSFDARLGEEGTNPEELMAAAQAACAAMSLYNLLQQRGHAPRRIRALTDVQLEYYGSSSATINRIDIVLEADVPGIAPGAFDRIARTVKRHSPVAKALSGTDIEIQARLVDE